MSTLRPGSGMPQTRDSSYRTPLACRSGLAAGLVSALALTMVAGLLLGAFGLPAEAHHRPNHQQGPAPSPTASPTAEPSPSPSLSPSPGPSPTEPPPPIESPSLDKSPTVMTGVGITSVTAEPCEFYPYWFPTVCLYETPVVRGRVTSAGGSDAGQGVPGLSVTVTANLWYSGTATTDEDGWFEVGFDSGSYFVFFRTGPLTWTASTDGDATHMESRTAGGFARVLHVE